MRSYLSKYRYKTVSASCYFNASQGCFTKGSSSHKGITIG